MHKSQNELVNEINEAAKKVQISGKYYHYKNPDQLYKVLYVAVTEWNDELCVIYQAEYGEKIVFVRPLDSWLEEVEWNNKILKRFTQVQS